MQNNELQCINKFSIRSPSWQVQQAMSSRYRSRSREYHVTQYIVLRHFYYHYSPYKLAFQNIMRVGDQKLMINLEWPYIIT